MLIKDSNLIRLPKFSNLIKDSSNPKLFLNTLILKKAMLREGTAGIELYCSVKDGPEHSGQVLLLIDDRDKKYKLFSWLIKQQGKDIETIYNSDFEFRNN